MSWRPSPHRPPRSARPAARRARRRAALAAADGATVRLARAAYLMSGYRYLAEDLVQTSLTRAWTRWDTVSRAGNVDAYVHRMLVNAVRSAARRRWRGELPAGDG